MPEITEIDGIPLPEQLTDDDKIRAIDEALCRIMDTMSENWVMPKPPVLPKLEED